MSRLRAVIVPVTPFRQNCALIYDETSKHGAVIDPGGDLSLIEQAIGEAGLIIDRIILTHGHIDHAGGAAALRERLAVPVEGPHRADEPLLRRLAESGRNYGMADAQPVVPDRFLEEGDAVTIGASRFEVLHCPGHSPGHIVLFAPDERFAIVGDVLFRGSVGRTDIEGGDHAALMRSIGDKLLPLGDDVSFLCGHGPPSSIGAERTGNPFLQGLDRA